MEKYGILQTTIFLNSRARAFYGNPGFYGLSGHYIMSDLLQMQGEICLAYIYSGLMRLLRESIIYILYFHRGLNSYLELLIISIVVSDNLRPFLFLLTNSSSIHIFSTCIVSIIIVQYCSLHFIIWSSHCLNLFHMADVLEMLTVSRLALCI